MQTGNIYLNLIVQGLNPTVRGIRSRQDNSYPSFKFKRIKFCQN